MKKKTGQVKYPIFSIHHSSLIIAFPPHSLLPAHCFLPYDLRPTFPLHSFFPNEKVILLGTVPPIGAKRTKFSSNLFKI